MKTNILAILCASTIFAGCKKNSSDSVTTPQTISTVTKDCIPGSAGCSELLVQGDTYYTLPNGGISAFNGYADPSLRKDPQNNTIWLSYSWPNFHIVSGAQIVGIDDHLAKSTDGGNTFNFVQVLFPSLAVSNASNPSQQGYMESETSNILPVLENSIVTWYGVRLNYFVYNQNGNNVTDGSSFQVKISKASSPENLTNAPSCILTSTGTNAAWFTNKNLSTLNPDLADVGLWNEPALYYENGTLFLELVSFVFQGNGQPNMSRHAVHIFSTTPNGDPSTWQWSYRGKLAGSAEAAELGAERLTQIDIAKGTDGKLLMIATPDDWNSAKQDYNHKGCKVLEIKSLTTPSLERDANGKLIVRAVITASDGNDLGSAASTYDAASSTGILFTRRNKTTAEFTTRVWRTGLKP